MSDTTTIGRVRPCSKSKVSYIPVVGSVRYSKSASRTKATSNWVLKKKGSDPLDRRIICDRAVCDWLVRHLNKTITLYVINAMFDAHRRRPYADGSASWRWHVSDTGTKKLQDTHKKLWDTHKTSTKCQLTSPLAISTYRCPEKSFSASFIHQDFGYLWINLRISKYFSCLYGYLWIFIWV